MWSPRMFFLVLLISAAVNAASTDSSGSDEGVGDDEYCKRACNAGFTLGCNCGPATKAPATTSTTLDPWDEFWDDDEYCQRACNAGFTLGCNCGPATKAPATLRCDCRPARPWQAITRFTGGLPGGPECDCPEPKAQVITCKDACEAGLPEGPVCNCPTPNLAQVITCKDACEAGLPGGPECDCPEPKLPASTSTTTLDPWDEFCKEACEEGLAGPECDCPEHPIG